MRIVAQRAEGGGDDPLRYALVGDGRDVVDAEAALPLRHEHVFAAQLQAADPVARSLHRVAKLFEGMGFARKIVVERLAPVPVLQFAGVILDMHPPVVGIGIAMEVAAQHRLRFVPFGHARGLETTLQPRPGVHADEVHVIGAQQQQLRHDGVVVVLCRKVAIGTGLGLFRAHRVGEVGRKGLAGITRGRDRRLLDIDPFAIDVGGAEHQRARRADGCDLVALGRHVHAQLVHLVARDLRVVCREIAGHFPFVAVALGLPVRLDRQVTAPAACRPGQVAGEAGHLANLVRAHSRLYAGAELELARFPAILRHQLGTRRLGIEIGAGGIDAVPDEVHAPFELGVHDGTLDQLAPPPRPFDPFEAALAVRIAQQLQIVALGRRGRAAGAQRGVIVRRAVTVDAADLHRIGDLAIDQTVAVAVLREMAIGALHALFGMDIHQMNRLARIDPWGHELALPVLAPFFRIVGADDPAILVEEVALAITLEDGAEVPAVPVIVGELRVLQIRIEVIDIAKEIEIGPFTLGRGALRVAGQDLVHLGGGGIFLLARPHARRIGFVIPHGVAEVGIQEDIGLMHVAIHALRRGNRPREGVTDRVALLFNGAARLHGVVMIAGLLQGAMPFGMPAAVPVPVSATALRQAIDGGIDRLRLPVAPEPGVGQRMARLAIVGIDDMAACAARMAVVAGLVVGPHEPGEGIVEPRLVDVEHRNGHAKAGSGATVRLLEIGPPRLLQPLDLATRARQADLGELRVDRAPAAFEHAEDVGGRDDGPVG